MVEHSVHVRVAQKVERTANWMVVLTEPTTAVWWANLTVALTELRKAGRLDEKTAVSWVWLTAGNSAGWSGNRMAESMDSPMVVTKVFQRAGYLVNCLVDCSAAMTEPRMAGNLESKMVGSLGSQRVESTAKSTADLKVSCSADNLGWWMVVQMVAQMVGWTVFHWAA